MSVHYIYWMTLLVEFCFVGSCAEKCDQIAHVLSVFSLHITDGYWL